MYNRRTYCLCVQGDVIGRRLVEHWRSIHHGRLSGVRHYPRSRAHCRRLSRPCAPASSSSSKDAARDDQDRVAGNVIGRTGAARTRPAAGRRDGPAVRVRRYFNRVRIGTGQICGRSQHCIIYRRQCKILVISYDSITAYSFPFCCWYECCAGSDKLSSFLYMNNEKAKHI